MKLTAAPVIGRAGLPRRLRLLAMTGRCHCERSEAIQQIEKTFCFKGKGILDRSIWIAASAAPPRNDGPVSLRAQRSNPEVVVMREKMEKLPAVYILASQRNGTLYVGVTSDLIKRIWEHKNDQVEGFTRLYGVHRLVYFEVADTMYAAISREKQIKAGSRAKKLKLIESVNPEWNDLYASIV